MVDSTNGSGEAESGTIASFLEEHGETAGDERDHAGDERDRAAERRDLAGVDRDHISQRRDQAAALRDRTAEESEAGMLPGLTTEALQRSMLARGQAAADRRQACEDREAGTRERINARLDRSTALADRGASARDREDASIDGLTGVYRRGPGLRELDRDIARAARTRQPLVVAFVDVDNLKATNDVLGHAAGDRMLLEVAMTLRSKLRSYDLIFRYGGDEFVCAISAPDVADAERRLSLVNAALAQAPEHGSVTVGLAELQPDDSSADVVARADAALYRERRAR